MTVFFRNAVPIWYSLFFCLALSEIALSQNKDWTPISSNELQMAKPLVEPDADAEVLLWEVYVADEADGGEPRTVLRHYQKIKIFTERGREKFSKVDIPFGKIPGIGVNIKIKEIAARTTNPDGTSVNLVESDVIEREIIKGNGVKLKAKSFAVPGIQVGSIIEYRWKETRGESLTFYDRLHFGQDIPVQNAIYHLKPLSLPGFPYGMRAQVFNGSNTPFVKEKNGFYVTSMKNLPSFKEEPRMPPEYSIRPWMLVYYSEDKKLEPKKFWIEHGKSVFAEHKGLVKFNDEIKIAAQSAIGDATTPEQKVHRIFDFVRSKIKNIYDDVNDISSEERKKIKDNKNASDTLKRGQGDWHDIDLLFASMASAVGLDARIVALSLRSDMGGFDQNLTDDYFLRTENVAVKIGDQWRFFDPSSRYTPFGMLRWEEEGMLALISDAKEPIWETTPYSGPEKSIERRSGKFRLLEDGTLEGEARLEFTGNIGIHHKEYNDDEKPEEREKILRNLVKQNILGSAEISSISIENVTDPDKPFVYSFKVTVPGYASRTGKRIFLQPNVFERSSQPLFGASVRQYDVFIEYAWTEIDDIEITLPKGYSLESPDVPGLINDRQDITQLETKMTITNDGSILNYKRNFYFGKGGFLRFPVASYAAVKDLFDAFHKANTHQITLRQAATTPPPPPPPKKIN